MAGISSVAYRRLGFFLQLCSCVLTSTLHDAASKLSLAEGKVENFATNCIPVSMIVTLRAYSKYNPIPTNRYPNTSQFCPAQVLVSTQGFGHTGKFSRNGQGSSS